MESNDKLKLIVMTTALGFLFIVLMFISLMFTETAYGAVIGMMVSFLIVMVILIFAYPVIFKDYIEEFWRKEEEKNAKKEE